jgi:hypothetical protein
VLSTVRRTLGALIGSTLVITAAGTVPVSAADDDPVIMGSTGDVQVSLRVEAHTDGMNSPFDFWFYGSHNGTSMSIPSATISLTGPDGTFVEDTTSFEHLWDQTWLADIPKPDGIPYGEYSVSFSATALVGTPDGQVEVLLEAPDLTTVHRKAPTKINELWLAPKSVPTAGKVTVSGTVREWIFDSDRQWLGAAGSQVSVYFDPDGDKPRVFRGTATADHRGFFTKPFNVTEPGRWYVEHPETDTRTASSRSTFQGVRATAANTHTGTVMRTQGGATAGNRLVTTDVVVGAEPVGTRVDVGVLDYAYQNGWAGVYLTSRRAEGLYRDGWHTLRTVDWNGYHSGQAMFTIRPTVPAGTYDVGVESYMFACPEPDWTRYSEDVLSCGQVQTHVRDRSVTTLRVRRASITTAKASQTTLTSGRTIALSGKVRQLKLIDGGRDAAYRIASNAEVRVSFDPAGAEGPVYKKTVWTRADGTFRTSVYAGRSGTWIATYPGYALVAPSLARVAVTVG